MRVSLDAMRIFVVKQPHNNCGYADCKDIEKEKKRKQARKCHTFLVDRYLYSAFVGIVFKQAKAMEQLY